MDPTTKENILKHYGVIRRSGRYPWGSGGNAYQSSKEFKAYLDELRKGDPAKGHPPMTDTQIAEAMGIKTTELRDNITKATDRIRAENKAMAVRLKKKDMSNRAIAERMLGDANKESTVRGWLETADEIRDDSLTAIANVLRGHLGTKRWLDVGKGTELHMGISDTRLRAAVSVLKDEGYETFPVKLPQLGTDQLTRHKILGHPGSTWGEARRALYAGQVSNVIDHSDDGGLTFFKPKAEPVSVSSKRIEVAYKEDGGGDKDGLIELRPGVPYLDLGEKRYSQVRVAVDGTHYLKGMAMYNDDLPAGTDIRFNTSKKKSESSSKLDAMKPLKLGEENAGNRWGAITNPRVYIDAKGKEQTSALNIVNEEGDWDLWAKSLSAQMLSKQSLNLAAKQLSEARKQKQQDLNEIMALTNPIVKKRLLIDFAESADSAAVHLKAAARPRQSSHVILPMTSMRPTEVYAPDYDTGDKVALVRYPHGGPFEIPQLTVNNKNTTAKRLMGGAQDAIGIHPSVAHQLSGADFDGDTVIVIPNDDGRVKSKPPLEELKNFDPRDEYAEEPGMTYMTKANTQKEMGKISNLITDMTIKGAKTEEIARAVKHSMVVIDAEKKKLNYKLSEKDNGIKALKATYQKDPDNPRARGASTLISRSKATARIPQRRAARTTEGGPIDPETGALRFVETGKTYPETKKDPVTGQRVPTGVIKPKVTKGPAGSFTDDASTLSSGTPMERVYVQHANALKAMANAARKAYVPIKDPPISPAAKAYYSKEVASLKEKLKVALMNAPLERRAQAVAYATSKATIEANPDLDKDQTKKIQYKALTDARLQVGAGKERLGTDTTPIEPREWEAIQSGALPSTTVKEIFNNSDMEAVKQLATPKYNSTLSTGQIALAKSMSASGKSLTEIAIALGIPRSTIADNLANA